MIMRMVLRPYDDDSSHITVIWALSWWQPQQMHLMGSDNDGSHSVMMNIMLMASMAGAPPPTRSDAMWWWQLQCDDGVHRVMMAVTSQSFCILLMTSTTGAPPPTRSTAWTEETAYQNTGQAILGRGEPLSGFHHPQYKSLFQLSSSFYSSRAS